MLNIDMKRHQKVRGGDKKAMRLAAIAFFLCALAQPVLAQTNLVDGTAYGTDYAALSTTGALSTIVNGSGSLNVEYAGTTNIAVNHDVDGTIILNNEFDSFVINAGNSIVSNSAFAVLTVIGGTNLTLNGGEYRGSVGGGGIVLPPIPGQPPQTNDVSSAAIGGVIVDTEQVSISRTDFSGSTLASTANVSSGTEGLLLLRTDVVFTDDGTQSSTLTGGDGGTASSSTLNTTTTGGAALYADDASVTISNGTFTGGNGGTASAGSSFTATTVGGDAINVVNNSTVTIYDGTFTGGGAGTATATGTGYGGALGGNALKATDSVIVISGGTFTGGSTNSTGTSSGGDGIFVKDSSLHISGPVTVTGGQNRVGLRSYDSDIIVDAGTFTGGAYSSGELFGLVSLVDSGQTHTVVLNGGTFNSIDIGGAGTQLLTAGTNLVVNDFFVVDGGTVAVDNLADTAFQNTFIREGTIIFSNDFTLTSGGAFTLDGSDTAASFSSVEVSSNATMAIGLNPVTASGNFGLAGNGEVSFSIITNSFGTISADTATFQTNSTLKVDATNAGFGAGTNDVILVTTTSGLSVVDSGGSTNSTPIGADVDENVNIDATTAGRISFLDVLVDGNSDLRLRFSTASLRNYLGFDGQLGDLADELDSTNNAAMLTVIDQYSNPADAAAVVEQTYMGSFNTFQTSLLGMRAAVGQSISRGTEFRDQLRLIPAGARGPTRRNELRGWGKYYGQFFNHDAEGINPEYDTSIHGGVVGIDKSFGNLLLGISGGAGQYYTSTDDDASENITAAHGSFFGTYGTDRAYIDAGVGYGHNRVTTETAEPFVLEGEYDARIVSAYLGGGYDLVDSEGGTIFTPEASIQYASYSQEEYTETSTAAVPRTFDEFDADSLLGSLGMNVSMQKGKALDTVGFKLEGRFHWMKEFNSDPGNASFKLEGGSNTYQLAYPSLDDEFYRIGIGCAFFNTQRSKPKNVMLRLDFDEIFGDGFNSHNLSAKLVYAF